LKSERKLLSKVRVGLLTYKHERFGVDENFDEFLKNEYNNSMKNFLADRKHCAEIQHIDLLLAGLVCPPKIQCLKEIAFYPGLNVIPIVLKMNPVNKFKLPFKSMTNRLPD